MTTPPRSRLPAQLPTSSAAVGSVQRITVVGASTAGLATAESLRAEGFDGDVVLGGAEQWDPYLRPALSKQVLLGAWEQGQAVGRLLATGQPSPYPIPFFWSEIHGARVQAFRRLDTADSVELAEEPATTTHLLETS